MAETQLFRTGPRLAAKVVPSQTVTDTLAVRRAKAWLQGQGAAVLALR